MWSTGTLVGLLLLAQLTQPGEGSSPRKSILADETQGAGSQSRLEPIADPGSGPLPDNAEPPAPATSELDDGPKDPPRLMAEVLTLPEGSEIEGRPLTLFEALSAAEGPAERLAAAHAYWRLVEALGHWRSIFDQLQLIESLEGLPAEDVFLRSARTSALAALDRAETAAVAVQHELAEAAMFAPDDPLPLPEDLPHVGPYRTHFDEIFSNWAAPSRARLMDRTLPVLRRAVDLRAAAVEAARDALDAAVHAHELGEANVSTVLTYAADWRAERAALVESVCRYNRDIAEYCLAVIPPGTDARQLVAMLITRPRDVPSPAVAERSGVARSPDRDGAAGQPSGVEKATMNESIADGARGPARPRSAKEPTLAPPREVYQRQSKAGTSEEMPRELPPSVDTEAAAPIPSDKESAKDEDPAPASVLERPLVPVAPPSSGPAPRTAERPVPEDAKTAPEATGLYPALVGKSAAVQAKQLVAVLHWFRLLPEPAGESVTLRECLRAVSATDRPEAVRKYWLASQRAAEYQAWVVKRDLLEELAPAVPGAGEEEPGSVHSRRLARARAAAEAEMLEARRKLLEAQFELAEVLGRAPDSAPVVPTTTPHSGPYLLNLDAQPRPVVASWRLRRLAATIPATAEALKRHARAVVAADSARATASEAYRSGGRSLDQLLETTRHQTHETLALLGTLGTYNRAIAEYVLAVLPPTVSEDQLIGTLVVE